MKLAKDNIEAIRIAGIIHDSGKICVPADILSKRAKLNENEINLIKEHPKVASDILKEIEFPRPVAQIILQHPEKLDDSDYPLGFRARRFTWWPGFWRWLMWLSDGLSAPLSPAYSLRKALDEIITNKGRLFDEKMVDASGSVFKKGYRFK